MSDLSDKSTSETHWAFTDADQRLFMHKTFTYNITELLLFYLLSLSVMLIAYLIKLRSVP